MENKDSSLSNSDDDNYLFTTNVNKPLSKILGIEDFKEFEITNYEPPKENGLSNCNIIIPSYYNLHKSPSKIFNIDYYEMIKDDIKNFRILNEYQIKYIKELPNEYKNEVFDLYNNCIKLFNDINL